MLTKSWGINGSQFESKLQMDGFCDVRKENKYSQINLGHSMVIYLKYKS